MSSSESDAENVIRYGTPLQPYEEDEIPSKRKYQQQSDQFAVDDYGRRKFHGAFTGGFSAGFGNTVGSQEGWTPSTFKSSRSEKAQLSSQRAEDFMDEEDRSEHGIAPRRVAARAEFAGQKRPATNRHFDGPIPGQPVLEKLLSAVHETPAARMLRRMGWRAGQGAGGRLTGTEKKKARTRHKVYGCYVPPEVRQPTDQQSDAEDSSGSEIDYDILFAPDDYEPYILSRKSDRFGLGYSGLSRHSVLGTLTGEYGQHQQDNRSHLKMRDRGKKVSIRGQAFGVGALQADDEDIYAPEDMSHYDFAIGGPSADATSKKPKQKGDNVLEGFVRSTAALAPAPRHPPPALPRDYVPARAGVRKTRFGPTDAVPRDQGLGRHELTAEARGALLGETPLPPKPPEAPQEDPTKTPDPIAELLGRNVNFVTTGMSNPVVDKTMEGSSELDFISIKDSGKDLAKTFRPFVGNPAKQSRYDKYLKDVVTYMAEGDINTDNLSQWERDRELMEFEQAAKLYKPLTGVMGDRFTHAAQPDDALDPLTAVAKTAGGGLASADQVAAASNGVYGLLTRSQQQWRPESLVCKRFNVPEPGVTRSEPKKGDKPKIAYSVFSYLESSVHDKDSFAKEQSKFSGSKSTTDILPRSNQKSNQNRMSNIQTDTAAVASNSSQNKPNELPTNANKEANIVPNASNAGFTKRMTVAEMFLKESVKSKNEGKEVTETIEQFDKMDLYKSIFLSDSEEEVPMPDERPMKIDFDELVSGPKNVERNLSPPRGIFANIDFDEINSWRRNTDAKAGDNLNKEAATNDKDKVSNSNVVAKESSAEAVDMYGPKIPENLKKRLEESSESLDNFRPIFKSRTGKDTSSNLLKNSEVLQIDSSSSSDSWVDAKEVKTKKLKKKKSKKHKSKHKKSKHKKKDK